MNRHIKKGGRFGRHFRKSGSFSKKSNKTDGGFLKWGLVIIQLGLAFSHRNLQHPACLGQPHGELETRTCHKKQLLLIQEPIWAPTGLDKKTYCWSGSFHRGVDSQVPLSGRGAPVGPHEKTARSVGEQNYHHHFFFFCGCYPLANVDINYGKSQFLWKKISIFHESYHISILSRAIFSIANCVIFRPPEAITTQFHWVDPTVLHPGGGESWRCKKHITGYSQVAVQVAKNGVYRYIYIYMYFIYIYM